MIIELKGHSVDQTQEYFVKIYYSEEHQITSQIMSLNFQLPELENLNNDYNKYYLSISTMIITSIILVILNIFIVNNIIRHPK